ncbi:MAG: hypothetical protein CL663_01660 [Bacteroidetes bacterium]|nr:hypothetical protein [Bacteroidota bacterium]|tara:strand:+ start:1732 stop:2118 length:387 start_codon:yes stop_codon:yes gene_type:complete
MNPSFIKFIKRLFVFSLIFGLIAFGITYLLPENYTSPNMPFILLFFFLVTAFSHYLVIKSMAERMSRFVNFFMISIFLKLVLYSMVIVIYALVNKGDVIPFMVTFLIFYLGFTVFELLEVLKLTKTKE